MTGKTRGAGRFLTARFLLLAIGVAALLTLTTALVTKPDRSQPLPVAQGVVDGSFHPIAGKFRPNSTQLDQCGKSDPRCLEQGFGNLAYHEGPKTALTLFNRRRVTEKTVAADCHRIAHIIGSASLLFFRGNVAQTYAHGSASCTSGYYHGILERAFTNVFSEQGLIRVARKLCRGAGVRRRGFLDYQCDHGLGHGLMIQTGYDLPMALAVCHGLQTRWDEVSCTGGAFMENGSTLYGFRSPWLKKDDPLYPCQRVLLRNRGSCYLRVTTQILRRNHFDFEQTVQECRSLQSRWRLYCFRSYGRDAEHYVGGKIKSTLRLCRLTGGWEGQCLYGAARTLADRDGKTSLASRLCRSADRRHQPGCFAGLGVVVGLLEPTTAAREKACSRLTASFARACATSAAAEIDPRGRHAWG
jgi:hypothetical protein